MIGGDVEQGFAVKLGVDMSERTLLISLATLSVFNSFLIIGYAEKIECISLSKVECSFSLPILMSLTEVIRAIFYFVFPDFGLFNPYLYSIFVSFLIVNIIFSMIIFFTRKVWLKFFKF